MTSSGPRYHIPFPRSFLSLNTPRHKATTPSTVPISPDIDAVNPFLSNRPEVARTASICSVSSAGSAATPPSSPPTRAADSPTREAKVPTFLALNSKFTPPPATARGLSGEKSAFLSNKH